LKFHGKIFFSQISKIYLPLESVVSWIGMRRKSNTINPGKVVAFIEKKI